MSRQEEVQAKEVVEEEEAANFREVMADPTCPRSPCSQLNLTQEPTCILPAAGCTD